MKQARPLPFGLGGFFLLVYTLLGGSCFGQEQSLLLDINVDGRATHKIVEFVQRKDTLLAHAAELRDAGLQIPGDSDELVDLRSIPQTTWRIDTLNQTLYLTTDLQAIKPSQLEIAGSGDTESHRQVQSSSGMTLNYDVISNVGRSASGMNGQANLRMFSPKGTFSSSWIAFAGDVTGPRGGNQAVRLDSNYQFADVDTRLRYSAGDFTTTALSWTRPIHMTGLQLRSDYSTRPDLVTFPLPSIQGSAAVPTTLNVLANGAQLLSQQVEPGPFQVQQLPVVMGAGNIAITMTNALGQQVTVNQSFYADSQMLAPKLQTFGVEGGLVRLDWGSVSNHYGQLAASGIYRRGLSSFFTVEAKAEAGPGMIAPGVGGVLKVGSLGTINGSAALSLGKGRDGQQVTIGAQRIGRVFSVGAFAMIKRNRYTDIAALNNAPVARSQISGNIGYSTRRFGTVAAAYGDVNQAAYFNPSLLEQEQPQRTRILSANYSVQVHRMAIYANEFRSIGSGDNSQGFQAGITLVFGTRGSADISGSSDGNARVEVRRPATDVGQWGYDTFLSSGSFNHAFIELERKSHLGYFVAGIDDTAGVLTARLETQGALSFVDRGLFASNEIFDSFAVVDTGSTHHVKIFEENRPVGDTGRSGKLLIADVRSFQLNHLAIDPTGIPLDATFESSAQTFRPRDLSGVIIRFNVRFGHSALLHITDAAGVSLPVGSSATLKSTGVPVTVGYDGRVFLQDLGPTNQVDVTTPGERHCSITFAYHPVPGDIPLLGPFSCKETAR